MIMKSYTINKNSHFKHLWSLILLVITMPIIGHYIMLYKLGGYTIETAGLVGLIFFVVFIGPILGLHFNHYFQSKGSFLNYSESQNEFSYHNKGEEVRFGIRDIQKITVYKSWSMVQGRTPSLPTDIYNYAVIELKDGQIIKLSSLLVYEFDKVVKSKKIEIKKTLYAWMS